MMPHHASVSSLSVRLASTLRRLAMVELALAASLAAQSPPQQYVFGSVPVTADTSQLAVYAKNGQTGVLLGVPGLPLAENFSAGAITVDALGRFLFVVNTAASNISMFQVDQSTGAITEVPGSPFSMGPTENPNMAAAAPVSLAAERSGQFLYVGYRFGNLPNDGAINEFSIDA